MSSHAILDQIHSHHITSLILNLWIDNFKALDRKCGIVIVEDLIYALCVWHMVTVYHGMIFHKTHDAKDHILKYLELFYGLDGASTREESAAG